MQAVFEVFSDFKIKPTVGLPWDYIQNQVGLFGGAIAFFNVATDTSRHNIFPSVTAATRSRKHMIEGKVIACLATVLTRVSIPMEDISSG